MGLATAFQILLIANLFANPEECPVPNSLQEIAEKAKKSVQHKLHREAFLAQFDSVDDFKIYNTERKSGTSENAPATPSYIFDRLETKANAGGTIDDLASLFANEIILYEKAQFEIFTASRKFYEENGWDFDLKLNQLQAKLNESPSDDLKQEYEKLKEKIMAVRRSVFDKFKAAGVPLLELPRLWNEGQNSVIQKALLETQPKFFEWLDKNPKAGWKEIERSGFLSPIVTEEVVRAWLRAYFLQGKNNEPGPVARITRKTFSMGEHLYLDTEQVGDGADEDLKKWIHSEQVAQYKAWNDEVEKELAELRKVNERFGEILNEQALRERLDLQLVQARARVLLQGRYSVRGRTLYKGDGVSIDWDFVEELGLTEVLSKEEVEETLIEKKLEYARESLLSYAEQLGQQLGKARDAGNQTEIRRLESSLKSDVNILNRWKEVDRVLSAHPEKLSRADIETQLKLRFERAAGMSEIFQLVERTRSQATSAWIESELKRRKLDQFMPIEKVLELAAREASFL